MDNSHSMPVSIATSRLMNSCDTGSGLSELSSWTSIRLDEFTKESGPPPPMNPVLYSFNAPTELQHPVVDFQCDPSQTSMTFEEPPEMKTQQDCDGADGLNLTAGSTPINSGQPSHGYTSAVEMDSRYGSVSTLSFTAQNEIPDIGGGSSEFPQERVQQSRNLYCRSDRREIDATIAETQEQRDQRRRPRKLYVDTEGYDLFWRSSDFAYIVEINFLMSLFKPTTEDIDNPLALTKLRPKEVSFIKISGPPQLRHWIINYDPCEGKQTIRENRNISSMSHGMVWNTKYEDADSFNTFFSQLSSFVKRGDSQMALYTMDMTVHFYLSAICKFKHVFLLNKEHINFDPYVEHCDHHPNAIISARPCTNNRVWAIRNHFAKRLSVRW